MIYKGLNYHFLGGSWPLHSPLTSTTLGVVQPFPLSRAFGLQWNGWITHNSCCESI